MEEYEAYGVIVYKFIFKSDKKLWRELVEQAGELWEQRKEMNLDYKVYKEYADMSRGHYEKARGDH
jgi:hypothetical protein